MSLPTALHRPTPLPHLTHTSLFRTVQGPLLSGAALPSGRCRVKEPSAWQNSPERERTA